MLVPIIYSVHPPTPHHHHPRAHPDAKNKTRMFILGEVHSRV
jgi:hypothetical protein